MGKKTSDVVMGMLSDAGSATRAAVVGAAPAPPAPAPVQPPTASPARPATPGPAPDPVRSRAPEPTGSESDAPGAPRTLRLRPEAAGHLRAAWLDAKRDDVLLTAQDFASDLVEEALAFRRRRRRTASSA